MCLLASGSMPVKKIIGNVIITISAITYCYQQGPRTQGGQGGPGPLKIGDLFSKSFGKRENLIFLFIRAPLEKNRSSAPAYHSAVEQYVPILVQLWQIL